jgi:hypothetical protein
VSETTVGFLILAVGIVLVLSLVFAVTLRGGGGGAQPRTSPPPGVHMPSPSMLPVVLSVGAALLGAGLIFKPDDPYQLPVLDLISRAMNPLVGLPGLAVLLYGVWSWVRDAGHEWRETEAGSPHDTPGH